MYWTVPRSEPSCVSGASCVGRVDAPPACSGAFSFANPKSRSFAPALVSMMLPGLRSRWITPASIRGLQCLGDLLGNRQRLVQRDRPRRDSVSEGRPFNQFEDERLRAVGFLDTVDGGDVGVVEAGEDLRLPLEPSEPIRISRESVGQDLQGDLAIQLGVGGLPDLTHAPFAEEGGHVVVPEAGAGAEGHDLLSLLTGLVYAQAVQRVHRQAQMCPEKARRRGLRGSAEGGLLWAGPRASRAARHGEPRPAAAYQGPGRAPRAPRACVSRQCLPKTRTRGSPRPAGGRR